MFALFDDAGKFLAGRVMSEADASLQVELDSGKRVKVKGANVLLKFEQPAPAALLAHTADPGVRALLEAPKRQAERLRQRLDSKADLPSEAPASASAAAGRASGSEGE